MCKKNQRENLSVFCALSLLTYPQTNLQGAGMHFSSQHLTLFFINFIFLDDFILLNKTSLTFPSVCRRVA